MSLVVYAVLAAIMALVILYVLYTHISSLHAKIDALIVQKIPQLAPVLTGDHVVATAQAVGQAVARSVQAVSNPLPTSLAGPPASQTMIDWNQYATVQDAILRLQGKGLGVDQIVAQWTAAHPGSDPTHVDTPSGQRDTSPVWNAFDGHACRVTSEPGKPMTFTVNVGKPFTLSVSECPGVNPGGTMTITAVQNGTQVATITKPFAQAVDLPVPVGDAVVTAVYDKVSTFDVTVRQG